jgi:hypothetical protein
MGLSFRGLTQSEIKLVMTSVSVLYVEVPLENHVKEFLDTGQLLEKKRHWHEHINFFSENALKFLIFKMGFNLLSFKVETIKHNGKPYSIFMLACSLYKPKPLYD